MTIAFVLERPKKYGANIIDQDGLWKRVIADLFEDFLLFLMPDLYDMIDFKKKPEFLQQELFKEILKEKKVDL